MSLLPFLLAAAAQASPADLASVKAACETPEQIKAEVFYCSDNTQAVAAATRCRDALKKMWDNAPRDVNPEYAGLFDNNDGKQQLNFSDSHRDYKSTMNKLAELVNTTERSADLVAQFPVVMVDYPGAANDPNLSAPCYQEQVAKVAELVHEMDRMILEGKDTYAQANGLRATGVTRDEHIDSSLGSTLARGVASVPKLNYDPAYPPFTGESDITGTVQEAQKDALGEFQLRGQLTGTK